MPATKRARPLSKADAANRIQSKILTKYNTLVVWEDNGLTYCRVTPAGVRLYEKREREGRLSVHQTKSHIEYTIFPRHANVKITTGFIAAAKKGFFLLKWKAVERHYRGKTWFYYFAVDPDTLEPVEDKEFLKYPLLAIRNPDDKIYWYGLHILPKFSVLFRNYENNVIQSSSKSIDNTMQIFRYTPLTPAPTCSNCLNIVETYNFSEGRWKSYCKECKKKYDSENSSKRRLDKEGVLKQFASDAMARDARKNEDAEQKWYVEKIRSLVEAARDVFGEDVLLSMERRLGGKVTYAEHLEKGTLVFVPFRFNIGGQASSEEAGKTGKSLSLEFFVVCEAVRSRGCDFSSAFRAIVKNGTPDQIRIFNAAQSYAMKSMNNSEKKRKEKEGIPFVRRETTFVDVLDKYGRVDSISGGKLPLTFMLHNKLGVAGKEECEATISTIFDKSVDALRKEDAALISELDIDSGSPLYELLKFSPERLDNDNNDYVVENVVPIITAFQCSDYKTVDPGLERRRREQKWQPSVFRTTDFAKVANHMQLAPSEAAFGRLLDIFVRLAKDSGY